MKNLTLNFRDKTAVYIDWANVYGWRKTLKGEPDPQKIYKYLSKFKQLEFKGFYYGTDKHPKSKKFIKKMSPAKAGARLTIYNICIKNVN